MAEEQFIDIKKETILTADQLIFLKENPSGLTKEGCEAEIVSWKKSRNKGQLKMYEVMLKACKVFTSSGKTTAGAVIFSRDKEGKVTWVDKVKKEA